MSNEKDKKDILKQLNNDNRFHDVINSIKDEKEKMKTKALAEDIFLKIAEGFIVMKKIIDENPEAVAEAARKRIDKDKDKDK